MARRVAFGLACLSIASAVAEPVSGSATVGPAKVMRYAFRVAETGFDPGQVQDLYSRIVTGHIFEAPYEYDPLARPAKVRLLTAAAPAEHSEDYRTWTVRIRPGIYFADDPAFKGQRRELTAQDYVYSIKRFADPAVKSPAWTWMETYRFVGLAELRKQALESKKPFDYDRPIEGLVALDRYTIRYRMEAPQPRFVTGMLAGGDLTGAVAREVVEFYGDRITAHPVGTGPFRLAQWRRSSFIALERSPHYRERLYEAEPAADDAEGQALLARFEGRRLPMLDRVEISIIEEQQPRWLTFLQRGSDLIEEVPPEFVQQAMPGGKVAPNLAKDGIQAWRTMRSDLAFTLFNMDDPVLGGIAPAKVALRRAIGLAYDTESDIRLVRRGQAVAAQSPVVPNTTHFDPTFRSEMGEYSPARAKALLDLYGYTDLNGDGWRDRPDGQPLLLRKATQPDQLSRQIDEQWKRDMTAVGLRIEFAPAKWPENLKAARAGKLMMWSVGGLSASPDSLGTYQRYDSRQIGGQNNARFRHAGFDAIYDRLNLLPDGPEREALFHEARRIAIAFAPYKLHVHRIATDMAQPWVIGYRRPLFWQDWWQYIDIDESKRPAP
jgi:ABC-type transport system substrate-binding protein